MAREKYLSRVLNPGPLGEKRKRILCALQPPPNFKTLEYNKEDIYFFAQIYEILYKLPTLEKIL